MLSTISANSRIEWEVSAVTTTVTTIICSHPSFQISSQQLLVSAVSKSTLQNGTGIHWTLPWHRRFFTLWVFLLWITSTFQISEISHCLASLHLSTCFGSICHICRVSITMTRINFLKLSSPRSWCCPKFVNSIFQIPTGCRWSC